jgi:hypothetical protein
MTDGILSIDGLQIPRFLYGTAWKEERTQRLTAKGHGRVASGCGGVFDATADWSSW